MAQPYKQCPQCKQPAPLAAQTCASCGHVYRTQFVPPSQPQPTQMFTPQTPFPAPVPKRAIWPWLFGGCCGVPVLLVVALWILGHNIASEARSRQTPETLALAAQMHSCIGMPMAEFVQHFGRPTSVYKEAPGSQQLCCEYQRQGGRIRVFVFLKSGTVPVLGVPYEAGTVGSVLDY